MTKTNIYHKFSLKEKIVVVTGGDGLLGHQLCRGVIQSGGIVICADIAFTKKDILIQLSEKCDGTAVFMKIDITSRDSIRSVIKQILEKYGKIDSWNNLAYPRTKDFGASFEDIKDESWDANISMHLNGYFKCSQEILAVMRKQNFGSLVNYGSIYGVLGPNFNIYEGTGMDNPAEYAAIKGGIINLTKYLATYYGKYKIRVNSICPGGVFDSQNELFVKNYSKLTPLGRMADPDEIAAANIFLISDAASYITGQVIMVDGGWSTW